MRLLEVMDTYMYMNFSGPRKYVQEVSQDRCSFDGSGSMFRSDDGLSSLIVCIEIRYTTRDDASKIKLNCSE